MHFCHVANSGWYDEDNSFSPEWMHFFHVDKNNFLKQRGCIKYVVGYRKNIASPLNTMFEFGLTYNNEVL